MTRMICVYDNIKGKVTYLPHCIARKRLPHE